MVSLRGRQLKLLSLRRWFEVEGRRCSELALAAGQRIVLAPEVVLEVERVSVAPWVVGLAGVVPEPHEPHELSAPVNSLVVGPDGIELHPGFEPDAAAHVSSSTDGWVLRHDDGTTVDLRSDTSFQVAGVELSVVQVPVEGGLTTAPSPSTSRPMRIVARLDTVHLHPEGRPSTVLTGIAARIVSELVAMGGGPVGWEVVAREIWVHGDERLLRQNWDRNMRHLRSRMRSVGLRDDLVRPDGKGNTELFLLPGDEIVDEM